MDKYHHKESMYCAQARWITAQRIFVLCALHQNACLQLNQTLTFAINRWKLNEESKALQQWASQVIQINEDRTKAFVVLRKMLQQQLTKAFTHWRDSSQFDANQARLLAGALNRMRNLKLSQAWEQWQFAYSEAKRQMELLRRAAMKLVHRQLARAFEAWRAAVRPFCAMDK